MMLIRISSSSRLPDTTRLLSNCTKHAKGREQFITHLLQSYAVGIVVKYTYLIQDRDVLIILGASLWELIGLEGKLVGHHSIDALPVHRKEYNIVTEDNTRLHTISKSTDFFYSCVEYNMHCTYITL